MELDLILERELTTRRPPGGSITDLHVRQRESGEWHIDVRVSWRGSTLFHVAMFDKRRIRLYKKISSALRHIVSAYDYKTDISVHPFPGRFEADDF